MRRIVLDTETTGLDATLGHRIIEIGGVELIDRSFSGVNFHRYLNPEREIDQAATEVHGMTRQDLADKPLFADLADEFLRFVDGAELVIHNAPFDVAFLNAEYQRVGYGESVIEDHCEILDSLVMARGMHPGQRNSLDALCKRYDIDNSTRSLHGALLDAEILADVYLAMTGGQTSLLAEGFDAAADGERQSSMNGGGLEVNQSIASVKVRQEEFEAHEAWLDLLDSHSDGRCVWRRYESKS